MPRYTIYALSPFQEKKTVWESISGPFRGQISQAAPALNVGEVGGNLSSAKCKMPK